MSVKSKIKTLCVQSYRRLPSGFRSSVRKNTFLNRFRERYFEGDTSLHNLFYSDRYYDSCEDGKWAIEAAPFLASDIIEEFHPADVIDVGCGLGEYLEALVKSGVQGHGVELAAEACRRCVERGLDVVSVDLSRAQELPWRADVVYSYEVAEHIPGSAARNYVRLMAKAARKHIVMTAALPGQPGLNHINCQPKSYWIELLAAEGFDVDQALIDRWQAANRDRAIAIWFTTNFLIFHRRGSA